MSLCKLHTLAQVAIAWYLIQEIWMQIDLSIDGTMLNPSQLFTHYNISFFYYYRQLDWEILFLYYLRVLAYFEHSCICLYEYVLIF